MTKKAVENAKNKIDCHFIQKILTIEHRCKGDQKKGWPWDVENGELERERGKNMQCPFYYHLITSVFFNLFQDAEPFENVSFGRT